MILDRAAVEAAVARVIRLQKAGPGLGGALFLEAAELAEELAPWPREARLAFASVALAAGVPENWVFRDSLLTHVTGRLDGYRRITTALAGAIDRLSPSAPHYIYWCVGRQLFADPGRFIDPDPRVFVHGDLFALHQAMVGSFGARLAPLIAALPRTDARAPLRRIAIVSNQLIGTLHQPTRQALDFARLLEDEFGVAVALINVNGLPLEPTEPFFPPFVANSAHGFVGVGPTIGPVAVDGRTYQMASIDRRAFDFEKLASALAAIGSWRPDLVVGFGGGVIAADLLADRLPVMSLATSNGPTYGLGEINLGYSRDGDPYAGLSEDLRAPLARRHRPFDYGFSAPAPGSLPTRASMELPEDAKLFVVIGNRLDIEVTDGFLELLRRLLARVPKAIILFVGRVTTLPARLSGQPAFRALGHVADVPALLTLVDGFLNPPRSGGGVSAAFALAAGVPIVTLGGDVAAVAGPAFTIRDEGAFLDTAERWTRDPAFAAQQRAASRARYGAISARRELVEEFLARGEEARALFAARRG